MKNVTIYMEVSQAVFMEMIFKEKPEGDEGTSVLDTRKRLSKGSIWVKVHLSHSRKGGQTGGSTVSKGEGRR